MHVVIVDEGRGLSVRACGRKLARCSRSGTLEAPRRSPPPAGLYAVMRQGTRPCRRRAARSCRASRARSNAGAPPSRLRAPSPRRSSCSWITARPSSTARASSASPSAYASSRAAISACTSRRTTPARTSSCTGASRAARTTSPAGACRASARPTRCSTRSARCRRPGSATPWLPPHSPPPRRPRARPRATRVQGDVRHQEGDRYRARRRRVVRLHQLCAQGRCHQHLVRQQRLQLPDGARQHAALLREHGRRRDGAPHSVPTTSACHT